jgi:flagellar motor protein MotB
VKSLIVRTVLGGCVAVPILSLVGCAPGQTTNPFTLRRENAQLKTALRQYQDQLAREKARASELDADNEELQKMYAEQKAEADRAREESSRIAATTPPRIPRGYEDDEEKLYGPPRGRGAAASRSGRDAAYARDAYEDNLPLANIPGAQVARRGDTVRIRVTSTSLFDPGKANLKSGASKVLDQVAASIRREYPGHIITIEGHTDSDPIRKSKWNDNHDLAYHRALAVYNYLSTKAAIPNDQLAIASYGPNMPVASNSSSNGKAQNRRVEFVIQPDNARAMR